MTYFAPLSARALAREIAAKRLSPKEALQIGMDRAAACEDQLRVFTHQNQSVVPAKGPLGGIAVGVKDIFDTHDMPTSHGSPIYQDYRPPADASLVAMLRNAGATLAGKTVTTEFAWFSPGPTRNPHNPAHTPGGSSSGSAAGVAAGIFPAAIGSQTGGSVIRPAAFCGIAGYKPSFRLFPTVGMKHFSWSLDTAGFFGAGVEDTAFVAAACSGRDLEIDPTLHQPVRFGICRSSLDHLLDDDGQAALSRAAKKIRARGGSVKRMKIPKTIEAAWQAHGVIQDFEANLALAHEQAYHKAKLTMKLRNYLREAAKTSPETYDNARRIANKARKASHSLFDACDVLLLPSAPGAAPRTLRSTGDSSFNRLWTLLGLPCVNVPGMMNADGLPVGVQVIAPFGKDKLALNAAHWLQTALRS